MLLFVLFFGLSTFALARPLSFADWLSPYAFVRNRFFEQRPRLLDYSVAYGTGFVCFGALMLVSFALGGFMATAVFKLYEGSPFAYIFFPI